jgi:hypothetical protein
MWAFASLIPLVISLQRLKAPAWLRKFGFWKFPVWGILLNPLLKLAYVALVRRGLFRSFGNRFLEKSPGVWLAGTISEQGP